MRSFFILFAETEYFYYKIIILCFSMDNCYIWYWLESMQLEDCWFGYNMINRGDLIEFEKQEVWDGYWHIIIVWWTLIFDNTRFHQKYIYSPLRYKSPEISVNDSMETTIVIITNQVMFMIFITIFVEVFFLFFFL